MSGDQRYRWPPERFKKVIPTTEQQGPSEGVNTTYPTITPEIANTERFRESCKLERKESNGCVYLYGKNICPRYMETYLDCLRKNGFIV